MRHLLPLALAAIALSPPVPSSATPPGSGQAQAGSSAVEPSSSASKTVAPPSNQARALSRALVPKQTWDRLLDRSAEGLSQAVSRSLTDKGAKVPSDLQGNIRRELGQNMKYDATVDTQAQALQRRFTAEEMDKAAQFYGSAVGQKMLQHLPEAQSEVGDALQQQLATLVPEILHRVAPDAVGLPGHDDGSGASSDDLSTPRSQGTGGGSQ